MFLILFPIFLFLILILSIHFKGSPFFFQKRPGKSNVVFDIMKFKTMKDSIDEQGITHSDEHRITWLGSLVRKTSLDEIPQLINVLKGDMSLVGPRPLLPEYLPLYSSEQIKRHSVKPGVTGWAQINGRNAISWSKKFEYDIWYAQNLSLSLDLKILFATLWNVVRGKGVSQKGHVTVGRFTGGN
ncbi:lipopolysaccharide/colanic/teichoic acid biosynthesis glycosyltransferase [Algoriphagus boseongensis]|uniref:Lipopolysaccharide/colanic/teichoic acid biosynthesis glycosyltransferase n=2 Tax=Algoriphagus boseongensis TaxID=1442587 RepID=A0A4R6TD20_9BACT|nr:lipopolysaccharide/colanic/teichoic acid biosynthesis glycosyltransferase [Algoriphagus boseongensis]